ncbi:TPA: alpha/beta hydrolase [Streptococcus suis]
MKKIISNLLFGSLILSCFALEACDKGEIAVTGTYSAFLQGNDWGENISRITLELDKSVDRNTVSAEDFLVRETKEVFDWQQADKGLFEKTTERKVTNVYISDKEGNESDQSSEYLTLEFSTGPNDGRYYLLSPDSPSSQYPKIYKLDISLSEKSDLTSNGKKVSSLKVNPNINQLNHSAKQFTLDSFKASDGVKYEYAQFTPQGESETLVVWLHGLLEGGATNTDPYITILGNEAANLGKEDFQKEMGGAHILAPQSPSFWMDKSGKDQLIDGKINSDGTSYYTKSLHELIQSYKEKVGAKTVIIAGCSNGGYMGMILAREYGKEYDGYMLICEAMENRFVTDEDIQKLKNLPLYFIYSTKDPLVIPEENEIPTIERLKAAGATNLQVAVFDEVLDTSATIQTENGKPYDFGGHSVWVPFFNNEVVSQDGVSAWDWIAELVKK